MRTTRMKAGERGMSLLEMTLAMALLASMSAGIFMVVRSQQEGFSTVMRELRGLQQTSEGLEALVGDLRTATAITVDGTNSLSFTPAGGGTSTVRLGPAIADDPRNRPLLYDPAGAEPERELTRSRILQNHNPDGLTLQGAAPDKTVALFSASGKQLTITLVLQAQPAAPLHYLRTGVTRRTP